jgi:hypothetical protein
MGYKVYSIIFSLVNIIMIWVKFAHNIVIEGNDKIKFLNMFSLILVQFFIFQYNKYGKFWTYKHTYYKAFSLSRNKILKMEFFTVFKDKFFLSVFFTSYINIFLFTDIKCFVLYTFSFTLHTIFILIFFLIIRSTYSHYVYKNIAQYFFFALLFLFQAGLFDVGFDIFQIYKLNPFGALFYFYEFSGNYIYGVLSLVISIMLLLLLKKKKFKEFI